MREMQTARSGRRLLREGRKFPGQQRELHLASQSEVRLHLLVLLGDLATLNLQLIYVRLEQRGLQAHQFVHLNQPEIQALVIDQNDIVVKLRGRPRKDRAQHFIDRHLHRNQKANSAPCARAPACAQRARNHSGRPASIPISRRAQIPTGNRSSSTAMYSF